MSGFDRSWFMFVAGCCALLATVLGGLALFALAVDSGARKGWIRDCAAQQGRTVTECAQLWKESEEQ